MATNPMGKGTKTIGLNMKLPMARELEKRASSLGISTGAYCKIVIRRHLVSQVKVTLSDSHAENVSLSHSSLDGHQSQQIVSAKGGLSDNADDSYPAASTKGRVAIDSTIKTVRNSEDVLEEPTTSTSKIWVIVFVLIFSILVFFVRLI